jgi:hypothetical protein
LILIDKYKDLFEEKNFKYHLERGRILFSDRRNCKSAIEEYLKGISLVNSDKKINSNEREYYLAWAKYAVAWCYDELVEKDVAEGWRNESEKHNFNYEKIPEYIRTAFPMRWHDDYEKKGQVSS